MELGDLNWTVTADTSDLERAQSAMDETGDHAERAGRSVEGMGGSTERSGRRVRRATDQMEGGLGGVTKAARLATAALAAVGAGMVVRNAIRQVADFQEAMNGLAAVSGATAAQMATLEDQARSLGATSQFSAQQAAEAQRFLAQAGFEVNETLGATPGILKLATAGQLNLADAADIASNVLGGMRLESSELNRVNDVLAKTAASSNTSIQQLGQALSFAAPFAASAGVSIEEASAAIGTMSDAGIQASRAGTGLVGTIRQLSKVTDSGQEVLAQYGLSIEDVSIESRGLLPVLDDLRSANISSGDAIKLFGSEAGAAAQVLVNDYSGAIEGATGEADRMAGVLQQGLTPAFKSLGSAASESVLQLGDSGAAGALESLVRNATGVISVWNGMGDAWAEANGVGEEHLQTINAIAGSIKVMTAAIVGGGGALAALAALTKGATAARAAVVALNIAIRANPLGLLITLAGAAAGAMIAFGNDTEKAAGRAENAANKVLGLTGEVESLTAAQIENRKVPLISAAFEAEREADSIRRLTAEYNEWIKAQTGTITFVPERFMGIGRDGGATSRLKDQKKAADLARGELAELEKVQANLGKTTEETSETVDTNTRTVIQGTEATQSAAKAVSAFSDSLLALEDRLFPLEAAQRQFQQDQILLQTALLKNEMGIERYLDALQRLKSEQRNQDGWQNVYDSIGQVNTRLDESSTFAEKFGGTMSSALEDAIVDFENFGDVAKGVLEDIQRMIIRQSITDPLAGAIGGMDWGSAIGSMFGGGTASSGSGFMSQVAVGQAHDGIDRVPSDGTWNLQKGERVVSAQTSTKLDRKLDQMGSGGDTTVQVIDQRSGGEKAQVEETRGADGMKRIRVMIRDEQKAAMSDGSMDSTMSRNYGVRRRSL